MTTAELSAESKSPNPHTDGISFSRVSKSFSRGADTLEALAEISFEVPRGGFVGILGPSGCGKSTLLRIAAGLLPPSAGEVLVHGQEPEDFLASGGLGFAFQDPALFPWRSVARNIRLPFEVLRNPPAAESNRRVETLIQLVGLSGWENSKPEQLSGGMKERVSLARALATRPAVLLLDEPFRSLDELTRVRLNLELQQLWLQSAPTTIMVTHSVDDAVFLSDEVIMLSAQPGRVERVWEVPLSRPRVRRDLVNAEYLKLKGEIVAAALDGASAVGVEG